MSKHIEGAACPNCAEKLALVHPALVSWFGRVKASYPDMHVSWGFRDQANQQEAFQSGRSKLPWPRSKHNQQPALAIDLFQLNAQGTAIWDPVRMAKVAAEFSQGIRWGGAWVSLGDKDHFQLEDGPELPPAA